MFIFVTPDPIPETLPPYLFAFDPTAYIANGFGRASAGKLYQQITQSLTQNVNLEHLPPVEVLRAAQHKDLVVRVTPEAYAIFKQSGRASSYKGEASNLTVADRQRMRAAGVFQRAVNNFALSGPPCAWARDFADAYTPTTSAWRRYRKAGLVSQAPPDGDYRLSPPESVPTAAVAEQPATPEVATTVNSSAKRWVPLVLPRPKQKEPLVTVDTALLGNAWLMGNGTTPTRAQRAMRCLADCTALLTTTELPDTDYVAAVVKTLGPVPLLAYVAECCVLYVASEPIPRCRAWLGRKYPKKYYPTAVTDAVDATVTAILHI